MSHFRPFLLSFLIQRICRYSTICLLNIVQNIVREWDQLATTGWNVTLKSFVIIFAGWAMVAAQLVERLFPTTEVCDSNPVITKFILNNVHCQLYWKDENKEKEAGNGPFKKTESNYLQKICVVGVAANNDWWNILRVVAASLAPWFRQRLPCGGLGFESQAHHLCLLQFKLLKMKLLYCC